MASARLDAAGGDDVGYPHPREYESQAVYRAYLFGGFRLLRGDEPLQDAPRRNRARSILWWFLLNPGKPVSAEELLELFWPGAPTQKALGNFHVTMHHLRRTLEPELNAREESTFVARDAGNFYTFVGGEGWWTDTSDVAMLFRRAQVLDGEEELGAACFYYRRVVAYCALGLLPDEKADEWLAPYRRRYRQIHLHALTRLMRYFEERDDADELVEHAYQMLQLDDVNETANRVVIESFLRSGNVVAAQQRMAMLRTWLQRQLGVRPTTDIQALSERIKAAAANAETAGWDGLVTAMGQDG